MFANYCLLPNALSFYPHEVDHVIALKHKGTTVAENLALACWRCNRFKGSDLGSFDPQTGDFSFLFNPRSQVWAEHFSLSAGQFWDALLRAERQRFYFSSTRVIAFENGYATERRRCHR